MPRTKGPLITLEEWCGRNDIEPSNARGYYLPNKRIPGAVKRAGRWFVPEKAELIRLRRPNNTNPHAPERLKKAA